MEAATLHFATAADLATGEVVVRDLQKSASTQPD
jgi:hypothetical protein